MLRLNPAVVLAAMSLLAGCTVYNKNLLTGGAGGQASTGSGTPTGTTGAVTSAGGATSSSIGGATASSAVTVSNTSVTGSTTIATTTTATSTSSASSSATTSSTATTSTTSVATSSATTTVATTAATTTAATTASASSSTGGCLLPGDCPGMDTACQTRTCGAGMCGFSYASSGTPTSDTTPGDCQKPECDGVGGIMMVADPTDPPTTTNQCMTGTCVGTQGTLVPKNDGTMCNQNGGSVCSNGNCVGCITGADCPSGSCNTGTCVPYILISEVRTRGPNGGSDEFIELYNPLTTPVILSSNINIQGRSSGGLGYTTRWVGSGQTLPAHGHFLIGGAAYLGPPVADDVLLAGLPDQMSLALYQGTTLIDALCFYCGANPFDATFTCEGTAFLKAGCSSSTTYAAAERKPGAALGNGTNTHDNSMDFVLTDPSNQRDLASPPTP